MSWYKLIGITCVLIAVPSRVIATLSLSEIYPAPVSGQFEWIEVINTSREAVNLQNFSITDESGKRIPLPEGFLEPGAYSIATSSSVLNNSDETVYLHTAQGELLEKVSYGTLDSTVSFTKCDGQWKVSKIITQRAANTAACATPSVSATPSPSILPAIPSPTPVPTDTAIATPPGLEVTEFMAYPETGTSEWVEFYNTSETEILLEGWLIDDIAEGGSKPVQFTIRIAPKTYTTFSLPVALLNNVSDTMRLLKPNGEEVFSFSYTGGKRNISWSVVEGKICQTSPTKNAKNEPCDSPESNDLSSSSLQDGDILSSSTSSLSQPSTSKKVSAATNTSSQPKLYFTGYGLPNQKQPSNYEFFTSPTQTSTYFIPTQIAATYGIILAISSAVLVFYKLRFRHAKRQYSLYTK